MRGWAANGWRNSKKVTVENADLMKALWGYISREFPNFEIQQCKGHNGDLGNELADALATKDLKKFENLIEFWELQLPAGDNWFPID
jgi:ribonuclease HI